MTQPLADDFASIAAAMRKHADGEPPKPEPCCHRCENKGWERRGSGSQGEILRCVCEACGNPEGLPCP